MNIPQTTYGAKPAIAIPGMVADAGGDAHLVTRMLLAADALVGVGLSAGVGVVKSAADDTVKLPGVTGDVTMSVAMYTAPSITPSKPS